jgi:hypothetical protein
MLEATKALDLARVAIAKEEVMALPSAIEVVTLFVDGISEAKVFYSKVFEPEVVYEDEVCCLLKFDGAMVNLLQASNAPPLGAARAYSDGRVGRQHFAYD